MKLAVHKSRGFTLIEILITITILSILFSIGFAGFRDFSRRQQLQSLANQLQGDLRNAQAMSLSGFKPNHANCNASALRGFVVSAGAGAYQITAVCVGGLALVKGPVALPSGFSIVRTISGGAPTPEAYPMFKVLGQGTNLNPTSAVVNYTITQTGTGDSVVVRVTGSGEIK